MASIPVARGRATVRMLPTSVVAIAERIAATLALIAVSPVLCACAAVLALQSGQSPLIAHRRVGWRGSTLWMLKLRTMWDDAQDRGRFRWIEPIDDQAGPLQKDADDPRVPSAFARFCRRHSVDELPQLLHVILGEMALIGPRTLLWPRRGGNPGGETRTCRTVADLGAQPADLLRAAGPGPSARPGRFA